jgi:hypothetical protein
LATLDELAFVLVQEPPGCLAGLVGEVDEEEVPDETDDTGDDAFPDEDP